MGRTIGRTVTITITETWTITWTTDETAPLPATTVVQDQPKPQEESDETILPAVMTVATADAQPNDVAAKPKAGSQRTRRRRATAINPVRELDVLQKGNSDE